MGTTPYEGEARQGGSLEGAWREMTDEILARVLELAYSMRTTPANVPAETGIPTSAAASQRTLPKEPLGGGEEPPLDRGGLTGRRFVFKTRASTRPNGNSVVSISVDRRTVLFERMNPLTTELQAGQRVRGVVLRDEPNYLIVNPERVLGPIEPLDTGFPEEVED